MRECSVASSTRDVSPMFDIEREQLRKTYQLCRLGFTILAVALVLACFDSLLDLFAMIRAGTWSTWIHRLDAGTSGSIRRSSGAA